VEETRRTVSVVIPTYRKKELLASTLSALGAQTYPCNLVEVVVIDDCSADGTSEFLRGLAPPFSLVALEHDRNRGRAAARNTAIRAAGGELVIFLDDDMRADPRLIEKHVRCHESNPHSAVIGNALTAPELGASNVFRYLDSRGVHKLRTGALVPPRYFLTNNASVPRTSLLEAGLFDEAFRSYGFEDTELAFRLERIAGLAFRYCADAVAHHIHHHSLDQLLEKRREGARSSLRLLLRKHPDRIVDLSVDALMPRRAGDGPVLRTRKLSVRAAVSGPMRALARRIACGPFLGRPTLWAIDLLVAAAYFDGLAESEASSARDGGTSVGSDRPLHRS
jgi:GT2 family glycosyltransferase